jgi:hypothetical protein
VSKSASGEPSVPQSQEKTPEQTTDLPNPELNPLMNPTLGRHLGRWAQVYFTSPPEKREEAVEELLRELQGNPGVAGEEPATAHNAAPMEEGGPVESIRIVEAVPDPNSTQCGECGHPYTSPQRFCGMCGATLETEQRASIKTAPLPVRTVEPIFTCTDLPSLSPVSATAPEETSSNVGWLREKGLSGDSGFGWGRARYAPAIIAVLAIGILFYAQSRPQKAPAHPATRTSQSVPATAKPEPAQPSGSEPASAAGTTGPVDKSAAPTAPPRELGSASPEHMQPSVPPASAPAAVVDNHQPAAEGPPASKTATEPASTLNPANGAAELAMAVDFLNGKTHSRNSEEAAKYLWRAVGKENPTAILLLSDMYLAGDGVPRSCDQARLLLTAAAKKSVPQAAEKLRDLLRSGCPK